MNVGDKVRVTFEGVVDRGNFSGKLFVRDDANNKLIYLDDQVKAEVLEPAHSPLELALAALPPSADEIAVLFGRMGIDGEPMESCGCPVAKYLRAEGFSYASVGEFYASEPSASASLPPHVRQFIKAFDGGDYPWLDAS